MKFQLNLILISLLAFLIFTISCDVSRQEAKHLNNRFFLDDPSIEHCTQKISGVDYSYRKAGNPLNPTLVLLHGFPTNKKTFDELIPMLASHYYVIAPDNSASNWSKAILDHNNKFTFSIMTNYLEQLLCTLDIDQYTLYIQNSALHVGLQLMGENPSKIDALIIQNADLYFEGLSDKRKQFYLNSNKDSSEAYMDFLYTLTGNDATKYKEYLFDIDTTQILPDNWAVNFKFFDNKYKRSAMVDLFQDYNNILDRFPQWQKMLRDNQPKTLIIWGDDNLQYDFTGAKCYQKDLPDAELLLINSKKYSDDLFTVEVASHVLNFLQKNINKLDENDELEPYLKAL